jgi:hypothetical protein
MVGMTNAFTTESVVIPVKFYHQKDTKTQRFRVFFIILFVFFVIFVV